MVAITEMTNLAVDLIDVRKTYRKQVEALRGVNIQVGRGEIFGLLGPNGAGKSTLVKIMMTVVRPEQRLGDPSSVGPLGIGASWRGSGICRRGIGFPGI